MVSGGFPDASRQESRQRHGPKPGCGRSAVAGFFDDLVQFPKDISDADGVVLGG